MFPSHWPPPPRRPSRRQWSDHFERVAGAYNARPHETVYGAPEDVEKQPATEFRLLQDNADKFPHNQEITDRRIKHPCGPRAWPGPSSASGRPRPPRPWRCDPQGASCGARPPPAAPVQRGELVAQVGRDHEVLVIPHQLLRGWPGRPSWRSCSVEALSSSEIYRPPLAFDCTSQGKLRGSKRKIGLFHSNEKKSWPDDERAARRAGSGFRGTGTLQRNVPALLELFKGSIGRGFEARGWEVVSLDLLPKLTPHHLLRHSALGLPHRLPARALRLCAGVTRLRRILSGGCAGASGHRDHHLLHAATLGHQEPADGTAQDEALHAAPRLRRRHVLLVRYALQEADALLDEHALGAQLRTLRARQPLRGLGERQARPRRTKGSPEDRPALRERSQAVP